MQNIANGFSHTNHISCNSSKARCYIGVKNRPRVSIISSYSLQNHVISNTPHKLHSQGKHQDLEGPRPRPRQAKTSTMIPQQEQHQRQSEKREDY